MASIIQLKPGQTVWEIKQRLLQTIEVLSVHPNDGYVVAKWNNGEPGRYYERKIVNWKLVKPEPKGSRNGESTY